MTKKKKNEDNAELHANLFAEISKGIGGELLEDRDKNAWGFIDTGILGLNYILSGKFIGGGVQAGACVEILGNSSSCKSLLGTNILRGVQTANGIPVMLDAERTISKDFAKKASRIDPNRFIVVEADTLEMCFNKIHTTIRNVRDTMKVPMRSPLAIVYDSIAVSPSEREFAETDLDLEHATEAEKKAAGAGADKPGERAKICSKELRKIPPILSANNCLLVIINQLRTKIGVMYGDPDTAAGGGRALEYYTSARLKTFSSKQIKDGLGKVIGINLNVKCIKNKCHMPFGQVNALRVFFNKGIDPFGGLLELLQQNGRIVACKPAGTYQIAEPFAGGKEIKFKSSKERNDVPASVLLECPAVVDADSPEQVQYYIDMFGEALSAVENDMGSEVDMPVEE
jgi:recombination protein RecA